MDITTAQQTIIEAINLAMTKGCFGIIESSNIIKALDIIAVELKKTTDGKKNG